MSKIPSLDQGISNLALTHLSKMTSEQFLADFKKQGITDLEGLVKQTLADAAIAARQGVAFDDETRGICYKFTTFRPHFDPGALSEVLGQISQTLIH
jgi:hypothetical protein